MRELTLAACSQAAAGGLVAYEGMGPAGISVPPCSHFVLLWFQIPRCLPVIDSRGEKMLYSGTDLESCITEYALVKDETIVDGRFVN